MARSMAPLGAEDVWTPAVPFKIFLDGAMSRGSHVEVQVYPGAYHGFDRAPPAPSANRNATRSRSDRGSPRRELPEFRTATGIIPIVGTDPAARQDALARVPIFLESFLMN
jgi:dienelactone hydrolase